MWILKEICYLGMKLQIIVFVENDLPRSRKTKKACLILCCNLDFITKGKILNQSLFHQFVDNLDNFKITIMFFSSIDFLKISQACLRIFSDLKNIYRFISCHIKKIFFGNIFELMHTIFRYLCTNNTKECSHSIVSLHCFTNGMFPKEETFVLELVKWHWRLSNVFRKLMDQVIL